VFLEGKYSEVRNGSGWPGAFRNCSVGIFSGARAGRFTAENLTAENAKYAKGRGGIVNRGTTVKRRGANLEQVGAVQLGRGLTEGNEGVMAEGFFISVLVFVFLFLFSLCIGVTNRVTW